MLYICCLLHNYNLIWLLQLKSRYMKQFKEFINAYTYLQFQLLPLHNKNKNALFLEDNDFLITQTEVIFVYVES